MDTGALAQVEIKGAGTFPHGNFAPAAATTRFYANTLLTRYVRMESTIHNILPRLGPERKERTEPTRHRTLTILTRLSRIAGRPSETTAGRAESSIGLERNLGV